MAVFLITIENYADTSQHCTRMNIGTVAGSGFRIMGVRGLAQQFVQTGSHCGNTSDHFTGTGTFITVMLLDVNMVMTNKHKNLNIKSRNMASNHQPQNPSKYLSALSVRKCLASGANSISIHKYVESQGTDCSNVINVRRTSVRRISSVFTPNRSTQLL